MLTLLHIHFRFGYHYNLPLEFLVIPYTFDKAIVLLGYKVCHNSLIRNHQVLDSGNFFNAFLITAVPYLGEQLNYSHHKRLLHCCSRIPHHRRLHMQNPVLVRQLFALEGF